MSPDAIADAALLEVSRWQRTPRKRTAQEVAASLWDERDNDGHLRDLEPHEQAFLTAVHQIGQDYTRVCGDAARAGVRLAVEFTARTRRDERYAAALATYEAARYVDGSDVASSCEI